MSKVIRIHPQDNTAVALTDLTAGLSVVIGEMDIQLTDDIPAGHKFALKNILKNQEIIKYGYPIGHATKDILVGNWIHTHNIKTNLNDLLSYSYNKTAVDLPKHAKTVFQGYRRSNHKVGIRNEIWIIPTVGCLNNVVTSIEQKAQKFKYGSIDAISAFPHPYGCSQMGDDQENTRKILGDLINHPNASKVLVLGLGCENSSIETLKPYIEASESERIQFLVAQDCEDEVDEALKIIEKFALDASKLKREPIDCSELIIGLKCGGSDGLSGITANPVVGKFSDMLISSGGTTILTEVPEMFGAETLLMNRCSTKDIYEKTVSLINDFKSYYKKHGQTIYENPSPGNKAGGITTLEDKSLGCTQKSGDAPVIDVLNYGDCVTTKGLNLLSAPGNDLVASTALAAAGAHIVLFTTGRGTPFACPVPTVKISTNSVLCNKKNNWIDFDCGCIVNGYPLEMLAEDLFSFVIHIASGEKTKSEIAGYHDMAIFKQGVTL